MSLTEDQTSAPREELAGLLEEMASRIHAAGDALQRTECLDEEQRAEVHAILEALRHDAESHATIVSAWPREPCHA